MNRRLDSSTGVTVFGSLGTIDTNAASISLILIILAVLAFEIGLFQIYGERINLFLFLEST